MKEFKEKTKVPGSTGGVVCVCVWGGGVQGHLCVGLLCICTQWLAHSGFCTQWLLIVIIIVHITQILFTKVSTATGTRTVINEDNTINMDVFREDIMTRDRINSYPMLLFPYMWAVNAWRHPVIGEVRATCLS